MSKAEEFIKEYTKNCSNIIETINRDMNVAVVYQPWLTPDQARRAVEIAKEELMEEFIGEAITFLEGAHEYIDDKKLQLQYDSEGLIRDFRHYMRQQLKSNER